MATIRAYLREGPHITKSGCISLAFGKVVSDLGINPNIELLESVLYTEHLPDEFTAAVRHYSIHDTFYGGGVGTRRKVGVYRLGDAEATVDRDASGKHAIKANGETLANVAELCKRIRAGSIAPFPSFEDGQVESTVLSVKEALHRLIDSLALAFGQWRLRLSK